MSFIILFLIRGTVSDKEVLCYSHLLALNWDINILGFAEGADYLAESNCV
jgi:hypothetical protein